MTDTAQPPEAPQTPAKPEPFQQPEFISKVQALLKGEAKPTNASSAPVIDKLKEVVAKQDALIKKGKRIEDEMKAAQGEAQHLAGKIDAFLGVLYGLEEPAAE